MSASEIITNAFGEQANLYTNVLGIKNDINPINITASQLRKAYYKRALLYHPDKQSNASNPEQLEKTKLKFQAVSLAYSILSDPSKKNEYDASGELYDEDDISGSGTEAWRDYFKSTFGEVTPDDIDKFSSSYKCSEAEESDVLKYYTQFKGNLDKMLECVMCSDIVDQKRWVDDYILPAISKGDIEDYMEEIQRTMGKAATTKRKSVIEDENEEDTTESEESGEERKKPRASCKHSRREPSKWKGGKKSKRRSKASTTKKKENVSNTEPSFDLIAAIRGKSGKSSFGNFISGMEEHYDAKQKQYDIPDDEFDKIRAGLESKRRKLKSGRK